MTYFLKTNQSGFVQQQKKNEQGKKNHTYNFLLYPRFLNSPVKNVFKILFCSMRKMILLMR